MTHCYARLLAMVALVMLMASGPAFAQTVDYDIDNDGYIDVSTHAQLNAIRYDINGTGTAIAAAYGTAFPNRDMNAATRMGCPNGTCVGYELTANIDLDTDGDGNADSGDAYWNSGAGWTPIGDFFNRYTGNFKGNGYTINNLFISRSGANADALGLFVSIGDGARIESLGITNADVTGTNFIGILSGYNSGAIIACYTTGSITGGSRVGGMVGDGTDSGTISSSYSTASVTGTGNVGGLVGYHVAAASGNSITNSYATGVVTRSSGTETTIGGLVGAVGNGFNATNSYWDTTTSGCVSGGSNGCTTSAGVGSGVTGQTTTNLQSPTGYTGIYANWNIDLDGDGDNDSPWDFGTASQYPTLIYGFTDYDADDDGYIEVANLAQLNAIRHDLNGDGAPTGGSLTYPTADAVATVSTATPLYNAAFPGRITADSSRMGCPSGACTGYELVASLDFDENGDGQITSADATYWDSGKGWIAIKGFSNNVAARYSGDFKGNGYTINNLFIDRGISSTNSRDNRVGLFGMIHSTSRIETLGVTNANVTGQQWVAIIVGRNHGGAVVACYTTGRVEGLNTGVFGADQGVAGGIVGRMDGGSSLSSSYSHASVYGRVSVGGLVGRLAGGSITNSYSIGSVTRTGGGGIAFGGLAGWIDSGSITNAYWNTQTSGRTTARGGSGGTLTNVVGKTTAELQSPTTYGATSSDTYYNWNADLDGDTSNDDPWNFGAMNQYPVLKYAGMDITVQFNLQPRVAALTLMPSAIPENGGMSTVSATLTRSTDVATTITVRPVAGAYTVGTDSTITIAAGQTANASDTVVLTAVDNTRDEPDRSQTLSVVVRNAQSTGRVIGATELTITDDDPPPTLLIDSPSAVEGNNLTFAVELDAASSKAVTVNYADASTGTAILGTDYTGFLGSLTFAAGATGATITVPVTNDTNDEPNETVVVTLSSAVNAIFDGGATSLTGTGTIIDNDGPPALSISSPSVIEGATGATLIFAVHLQPAHTSNVTVDYADAGTGTATSGTDYTGFLGQLTAFTVGATIAIINVSVTDDMVDEPNETVVMRLSNPSAGVMFDGGGATLVGVGTIIDDDATMLSIDSPQVAEGAAGATPTLRFTVSLSIASGAQVTVDYADAGTGSATSGTDYTALAAGTLTFAVGESSKSIDISVIGDAAFEQNETVVVRLSNAVNAALDVATGTGTITNDDRSPTDPEPDPDTDPTFTEAIDPQSYYQDKAIEPLTLPEATDGNGDLTYSLTELPEGLTFDAETRTVSGTPTKATEKAIYTLTVTDEDGDEDAMGFFLTIVANVLPSFGDASVAAQAYTRKQEITSLTFPQVTGGDEPLTYTLTPDLPEGLKFNAETRVLSGTPLEATDETTYTLTATDNDGDEATLMFTIKVTTDPIPTFGDTIVAAQSYLQHREIESMTLPQAFGGDEPLTYALSPDLPEGLTFDAETLTVSGTPLEALDETTYTLTATDSNGDAARLMFTLEVPDLVPAFGDTTIAAQSYLVNQEIASLTFPQASGGDGLLVYILLPFLPEGLSFDPTTRTLSGLPTEAMAEATYTLSALDADGDTASLTFTLEVSLPSPDFNGDGNVNFADFLIFAGKFNSQLGQERYDPRCDLNGDGEINVDDFLVFADSFGT